MIDTTDHNRVFWGYISFKVRNPAELDTCLGRYEEELLGFTFDTATEDHNW